MDITKDTMRVWKTALNMMMQPDKYGDSLHYYMHEDGDMVLAAGHMALWVPAPHPFNLKTSTAEPMEYITYHRLFAEPDFDERTQLRDEQAVKRIAKTMLAVFSVGGREVLVPEKLLKQIPYDPRADVARMYNPSKDGPLFFYNSTSTLYAVITPIVKRGT